MAVPWLSSSRAESAVMRIGRSEFMSKAAEGTGSVAMRMSAGSARSGLLASFIDSFNIVLQFQHPVVKPASQAGRVGGIPRRGNRNREIGGGSTAGIINAKVFGTQDSVAPFDLADDFDITFQVHELGRHVITTGMGRH